MSLTSLWSQTVELPTFPSLDTDIEADVVVAGGGIAGLTAAILLQHSGRRVVLLEASRVGQGETGHTTAHLTELLDTRYHVLEAKFGREGARLAAESSRAAIDRIEAFSHEFGHNCDFKRVPGYLFAETEEQREALEKELASLRRVGVDAAWADAFPLSLPIEGAVRIEHQAQFHPLEYLRELAAQFVIAGGTIYEHTEVLEVDDGQPCTVKTSGGTASAQYVLVLTNVPVSNRFTLHTTNAAYRSYAMAARLEGTFPQGLFWDMHEPYHYVRTLETEAGTLLIVGGEDHKTGKDDDTRMRFDELAAYLSNRFGITDIVSRWSGQIIEPVDGLPFIGKNPGHEHVYVATGFSGTGLTFGTLAGMIISDAVNGVANPWAELYDPSRVKPLAQAKEFVTENVDFPAHLVRDRLNQGEVLNVGEVPLGEGRLMRSKGKMVAVYRDTKGEVSACSAVCTHLGCYVHWNNAERSWDCPCHGSRFDTKGAVLNGPATQPLESANDDSDSHAEK